MAEQSEVSIKPEPIPSKTSTQSTEAAKNKSLLNLDKIKSLKDIANLPKLKKGVRNFAMGALMLGSQTTDKNITNQPDQANNPSGLYPIVDARQAQSPGTARIEGALGNQVKIVVGTETAPATKEALNPFSSKVVMVDFATSTPTEGINQNQYPTEEIFIQSILKDKYMSDTQLKAEFGEDYKTHMDTVFKKYPEVALAYQAVDEFAGISKTHGQMVAEAMTKLWEASGYKSSVDLTPIQNTFDSEGTKFVTDELGNKGLSVTVDSKKVIEALKQYPDQKVVNISFQIGDIETYVIQREKVFTEMQGVFDDVQNPDRGDEAHYFYPGATHTYTDQNTGSSKAFDDNEKEIQPISKADYEKLRDSSSQVKDLEKPKVEVKGAYAKDKAEQNLLKLFEIANAFPDKLIIAAAGNNQDNMVDALGKLQKPQNLLIVGEWSYQLPVHEVYGADLYVFNGAMGLPEGSSFSTATISENASLLLNEGMGIQEVKDKLMEATQNSNYDADGKTINAKIFDPKMINTNSDNVLPPRT